MDLGGQIHKIYEKLKELHSCNEVLILLYLHVGWSNFKCFKVIDKVSQLFRLYIFSNHGMPCLNILTLNNFKQWTFQLTSRNKEILQGQYREYDCFSFTLFQFGNVN